MAVAGNAGGAGGAKNIARAQRPRRAAGPTPMQLKAARAQAGSYASQGKQVERTANIQRTVTQAVARERVRRRTQRVAISAQRKRIGYDRPIVVKQREKVEKGRRLAEPYTSLGDAVEHQANLHNRANELQRQSGHKVKVVGNQLYKQGGEHRLLGLLHPYWTPIKETGKLDLDRASKDDAVHKAETAAPVLKVMDQTMRPVHAIAGGARAAVKGQNVAKATVRGAQLKDRYLFSDVLKSAGIKGPAAAIAGTALDIAADPTTYVSFGAGSVARKAAEKAAADTAKQAARAGLSEAGQQTVARQAAKRAEAAAPSGKGVTVKFAGKEVPGVRRGTAAATRVAKAPVRKVAPRAARAVPAKVRATVRHVSPRTAPAEVNAEQFAAGRALARGSRAAGAQAEARALHLARQLKRKLPADHYAAVIDAVERNDLRRLPSKELADHAHNLRSALKGAYRAGRRAGAIKGKVGTGEFLTSGDLARLRRTIKAEPQAQARRLTQLERHEQRAQSKAQQAEQAAQASGRQQTAVATERGRGQAATQQARLAGQARTTTERVRGSESKRAAVEGERARGQAQLATTRARGAEAKRVAVGRERDISHARQTRDAIRIRLRDELRKPVAARKGVPVLQARLERANTELTAARAAVRPQAVERVVPRAVEPAAPVSAIRPKVTPEPVAPIAAPTARAGQAAVRYESRAAQTQLAQRRLAAAKTIPTKGIAESQEGYLRRVVAYADKHDLPLVRRRASKLLASKPTDLAKGYFPREFDERIAKRLGIKPGEVSRYATARTGVGRRVSRVTPGFERAEKRRLGPVNVEREKAGQEKFSTDVPLATLNHLKTMSRATSQGEFNQGLAKLGRKVTSADEVHPGETLYKLGYKDRQFGLHPVQDVAAKPTKGGQYVALPDALVHAIEDSAQRAGASNAAAVKFDKATGLFKRLATLSLSFHVRNLIGDVQQSYLATPGHRLIPNIRAAGKAVRRASEQTRELRPSATDATVKVAGKPQHVDEFLAGARKEGVLDAGWIGRELSDLAHGAPKEGKVSRGLGKAGESVDRWMTNRENLMRLATYKAQLDKGLSTREAGEIANRIHIDYGELSEVERKALRRIFPFYTWTARSLPVTTHALLTRPGKFANIEKIREETGKAFTGEDELRQRSRMTEAVGRQLPFVIKVGGQPVGLSASLPATLLNELPSGLTGSGLSDYLDELGRFTSGMLSPYVRAPAELRSGVNLVTKRQIEDKNRPLTAAPSWVSHLPDALKKKLDVQPGYLDPKSGKKGWGWRGRADWGYDQLMLGAFGQAAGLARAGRAPQTTATGVVGALGVRADQLGPAQTKHAAELRIYDQLDKLNRRAGALNQRGINADNPTPEYRALRKQINALQKQVSTKKKKTVKAGPLSLGGGGGQKLPLGGGGAAKLPL